MIPYTLVSYTEGLKQAKVKILISKLNTVFWKNVLQNIFPSKVISTEGNTDFTSHG
jgi:hypothetical protein